MRLPRPLIVVVTVLLLSFVASACGGSSDSSSKSETTTSDGGSANPSSDGPASCQDIASIVGAGLALPNGNLAAKKAGVADIASRLKASVPRAPKEIKDAMAGLSDYYNKVEAETSKAKDAKAFQDKMDAVDDAPVNKAADAFTAWNKKNCN